MDLEQERILAALDAEFDRKTESVRQMLRDAGRHDLVEELDARLRSVRLGINGAQGTWHALSAVQRRTLVAMGEGRHLVRRQPPAARYDAVGSRNDAIANLCRVATVRNLASRELVSWEGGAFDPEAKAVLTERGRFVLKHGPRPSRDG